MIKSTSISKLPAYLEKTRFAEFYDDYFKSIALPNMWNSEDKSSFLSVDSDGLRVNDR
ncbi:10478_t:CDS:1, partial [Dentiscutata erythropus]